MLLYWIFIIIFFSCWIFSLYLFYSSVKDDDKTLIIISGIFSLILVFVVYFLVITLDYRYEYIELTDNSYQIVKNDNNFVLYNDSTMTIFDFNYNKNTVYLKKTYNITDEIIKTEFYIEER